MVLVPVATPFECTLLRERLAGRPDAKVIVTGVGPVNAAHATTVAILEARPDAIVVCGVGGSYPSAGLAIGDVVCAQVEIYGDLGAQSPTGFIDMKSLGFPVVANSTPLFNELPLQVFPTAARARFVTVSTCTGTDAVATELSSRTNGAVENMEGAAIAHVAHLHGIPVGEVRGISNLVTNRDVKSWKLHDAAVASQEAVLAWLAHR
ncbi:MAG TPA: futalosine hydrolase [Vicinamibacterales bacterium]